MKTAVKINYIYISFIRSVIFSRIITVTVTILFVLFECHNLRFNCYKLLNFNNL